jgi:hypothetical protein
LETFWDGGITVRIGDTVNGHRSQTVFSRDRMALAGQWLIDEAARLYPGGVPVAQFPGARSGRTERAYSAARAANCSSHT